MDNKHKLEEDLMIFACVSFLAGLLGLTLLAAFLRNFFSGYRLGRHYQDDMKHVNSPHTCASCGGTATEVVTEPGTGIMICRDRATCRQTIIWRNMLDSAP